MSQTESELERPCLGVDSCQAHLFSLLSVAHLKMARELILPFLDRSFKRVNNTDVIARISSNTVNIRVHLHVDWNDLETDDTWPVRAGNVTRCVNALVCQELVCDRLGEADVKFLNSNRHWPATTTNNSDVNSHNDPKCSLSEFMLKVCA